MRILIKTHKYREEKSKSESVDIFIDIAIRTSCCTVQKNKKKKGKIKKKYQSNTISFLVIEWWIAFILTGPTSDTAYNTIYTVRISKPTNKFSQFSLASSTNEFFCFVIERFNGERTRVVMPMNYISIYKKKTKYEKYNFLGKFKTRLWFNEN